MTVGTNEISNRSGVLWRAAAILQFVLPLSMRGLLILLALCYLVLSPILRESDIVASMITALLGGLSVVVLATSALFGFRLRKRGNLEVHTPTKSRDNSEEKIVSGKECTFLIAGSQILVPPLFRLQISLQFAQAGVEKTFHLVSGRLDAANPIVAATVFPHRGIWKIAGIIITLEDCFGISRQSWTDVSLNDLSVPVYPPAMPAPQLPVISSTFQAGDDVSHHTQRMGEPFDIKRYHPADGIKRILWKVFAKRGELVARHPEHAVTPEGHVIAFILAGPQDDLLAAWSLAYFKEIEDLNLTMEVGCLGMDKSTPLATNSRELEQLLVSSAFSAPSIPTYQSMVDSLAAIQMRSSHTPPEGSEAVALFVSESLFATKQAASDMLRLIETMEESGQGVTVCLQKELTGNAGEKKSRDLIERFFLVKDNSKAKSLKSNLTENRALFLNACALKNLTVFQEKGFARGVKSV